MVKKGTADATYIMRSICTPPIESQKYIFVCFIAQKMCNTNNYSANIGTEERTYGQSENLCLNRRAVVDTSQIRTQRRGIKGGVRQGCVLSPLPFSYGEIILRSKQDYEGKINNVRYADGCFEEKGLNLVNRSRERGGLKIS